MRKYVQVVVIVEGKTEQVFVEKILAQELAKNRVLLTAIQASKPGQKGGDIRWRRIKRDLGNHLKQRSDTFVTTMVDYYGTKSWPGLEQIAAGTAPDRIAETLNKAAFDDVVESYSEQRADIRFVPYISIHEFEALLFSNCALLAEAIGQELQVVQAVLDKCGTPEAINDSIETAPSKRIAQWTRGRKFCKTADGIAVAEKIGITQIRQKCRLFNNWLERLEALQSVHR